MTSFNIHGPFEVTYEKRKGGRTLVFKDFWFENSDAHYLAAEWHRGQALHLTFIFC